MKQRLSFLSYIATYYCLSSIFLFWKVDAFAKDVFVIPLYFIVPAGIGLLILSINNAHLRLQPWLTRPQLALGSAFIGLVAVTLLHQELERTRSLQSVFPWLFPSIVALSLLGYYRGRQMLSIDAATWKGVVKTLLLLLPFAAFAYYFQYLYFSSYPLRDIFQETHFMKGAYELSRTQVLNPYITASYLPFIQVLLGQLNHFYGVDLLRADWVLPLYAYFFHLACYAVFFSSLLQDRRAYRFALVLMTVLAPMFYVENMIMLESMLLVLFSILVRFSRGTDTPAGFKSMLVLLASLFVAYYFYFDYILTPPATALNQPPALFTGMWALAAIVFVAVLFQDSARIGAVAFLALLVVSAFGMHRGILLFMPMILLASLVYYLVANTSIATLSSGKRFTFIAWVLGASTLGFVVAFAFWYLNRYFLQEVVSDNQQMTTRIAEYLLRTTKIEAGGTGLGHSVVEYLRLSPPILILVSLVLLVRFLVSGRKVSASGAQEEKSIFDHADMSRHLNEIVYFVAVIAALSALVLSTVPYAYRGAFFPIAFGVALFASLMTGYAAPTNKGMPPRRKIMLVALALLAYMLLGLLYLYSPFYSRFDDTNAYLAAIRPLLMVIAIGGFLLFSLLIAYRHSKLAANILLALAIFAVTFDAVGLRTLFSEKAYGKDLPESGVISHYTSRDLDLGKALRSYPTRTILISDPYTLSILRGVTGLNSAYSFANINLVSDDADMYRRLFRYIAVIGDEKFSMKNASELLTLVYRLSGNIAAEGMYLWNHLYSGTGDLVTVDDIYQHFVWVINAKTFHWAMGEDSYYPVNSPIPSHLVSRLQDYFDIEKNIDGRLLVMRLKRQPGLVTGLDVDRHRLPSQPCICPPLLRDSTAPISPRHGTGKDGSR